MVSISFINPIVKLFNTNFDLISLLFYYGPSYTMNGIDEITIPIDIKYFLSNRFALDYLVTLGFPGNWVWLNENEKAVFQIRNSLGIVFFIDDIKNECSVFYLGFYPLFEFNIENIFGIIPKCQNSFWNMAFSYGRLIKINSFLFIDFQGYFVLTKLENIFKGKTLVLHILD